MSNPTVVVKYQTKKQYCSCCNQKLPQAETSKVREMEFTKETTRSWTDWTFAKEFPEDLDGMIPDFITETISFFAVGSDNQIIVEDSEIEKVKEFILSEVIE